MVARLLTALVVTVLGLVATGTPTTRAEEGNALQAVLSCKVSNTNPRAGSTVDVACSLIDNLGKPVSDTDITFFINFENRSDATYDTGRKTAIKRTNAQGRTVALINTGPTAGNFGVLVNLPGIYSSFTFVTVEPAQAAPAPVLLPLAPPPDLPPMLEPIE